MTKANSEIVARWPIMLIVALGTVVFVQAAARLPCISRDGVFFVEFAENLRTEPLVQLRGQTKQPGYSILLLGLHSLIGPHISDRPAVSWEVSGQIMAVLGGICVVGLVYWLTRRLFDTTTALLAAVLTAFWPQLVSLSSDVLSDAPHMALYLAALLLGLRGMAAKSHPAKWGALIACGALFGAGYWLRQEALGGLGAVVACLLWPAEGSALRRRIARAAVVTVAFIGVVAPYSIAVGKVMPNKSIEDLFFVPEKSQDDSSATNDAGEERIHAERPLQRTGPVTWWDAPIKMLAGWSKSGRYVLSTLALVGFFWPRVPRSERGARRLVFIAALLQIAAAQARGMAYGVVSDRYLLIPAALSIPWSAAGLLAIARFASGRFRHNPAAANAPQRFLTVAALIAIAPMAYYDLAPAPPGAGWQRNAGRWIAEHAMPTDALIAAPQLSPVSFYAGLKRSWPVGEGIASLLGRSEAVWFVDRQAITRLEPGELEILEEVRAKVRGSEPTMTWVTEGGDVVKAYQILRQTPPNQDIKKSK